MRIIKTVGFVICVGILVAVGYIIYKKLKHVRRKQITDNKNKDTQCNILKDYNEKNIVSEKVCKEIREKNTQDIVNNISNKKNIKKSYDNSTKNKIIIEKNKKAIIKEMSLKRKSRKKLDNTLRKIVNTILSNTSVQNILKIEKTDKFTKKYYKEVIKKMGLASHKMKIKDMLQTIMISLPPIPIIENILDANFSLNSIGNKEDKNSVITYLEKKMN